MFNQVGMFFKGIAYLMKVWYLFNPESLHVKWCGTPLVQEFQTEVANVNKGNHINFRGVKCFMSILASEAIFYSTNIQLPSWKQLFIQADTNFVISSYYIYHHLPEAI